MDADEWESMSKSQRAQWQREQDEKLLQGPVAKVEPLIPVPEGYVDNEPRNKYNPREDGYVGDEYGRRS